MPSDLRSPIADSPLALLERWNPAPVTTFFSYSPSEVFTLHRRFEAQADATPDAIAVTFEGEDWSFRELDEHANHIARTLRDYGLGPDKLAGLYLERGPALILAILAIHKAGGAYVPLDPSHPTERLQAIAEDAGVTVMVTQSSLAQQLAVPEAATILLDPRTALMTERETERLATVGVHSRHLAYLIYTSGSTGKPKGVEITHHSAVNLVLATHEQLGLQAGEAMLAITTVSFDISVPEIYLPLMTGVRMVLTPRGMGADGESFAAVLEHENIRFAQATPTTWRLVLATGWKGKADLKIVSTGEAIDRELANQLAPMCEELWNFYGPTETTVWSSFARMHKEEGPILIGYPVANNRLYILDEHLQPLGVGETGRLFIGGEGLARGYANRPELTAEKFIPDPFVDDDAARMYDTGDLARWMADGQVECLGRVDHQVKIRGYRIELGEIESVIKQHPSVGDAVTNVFKDAFGEPQLIGYTVPANGAAPESEELRSFLSSKLPDYMVPIAFEPLAKLPMTPSQKVDRKALPKPAILDKTSEPVALEGTAEEVITRIWASVLGKEGLSAEDHVFKLGAHSLHVARVHAQLRQAFPKKITIAQLFQYGTPAALAPYFETSANKRLHVRTQNAVNTSRDIAIIGMAGRFPKSPNLDAYWANLRDGVECIRDYAEDDLIAAGVGPEVYRDPRYVSRGCDLERHEQFDAGFFEMSPIEAKLTNPQHRIFLQAAWEALEHAGYAASRFEGAIGLYGGAGHNRYAHRLETEPGVQYLQLLVGNEHDYLTTRTAFKLGLRGPALNIQTACSTSLVAIHEACDALISGQCDMALAGGVSLAWPEGRGYLYEEGMIFSKDGHCRAFDANATGTVFSPGVGIVALKPLAQALEDGDSVHAVLRGIAINNDGNRKGSFAAPSIEGQAEVIAETLAQQQIDPSTISYVEAHGTGTVVGDPIEVAGLTQAYREHTSKSQYCGLGSVKTNIGHTDSAAGVAGLLKVVLAMKHKQLPPSLNFETPNPDLQLEDSPFYIQTSLQEWQCEGPRRAALSSFGLGGTNAHAILEEAPETAPSGSISRPYHCFPFSARTEKALEGLLDKWPSFLEDQPDLSLPDAAYTLQVGRTDFESRAFVVARDHSELQARLGEKRSIRLPAPPKKRRAIFLFTGQGAQYTGMARELTFTEPVFAAALDECSDLLEPHLGLRLVDALYPPEGSPPADLNQTALAQPALFAIAYAQARLWMQWGIEPVAMLGHSIGEYVAATLSGVFSLEEALRLVARRGALMQSMEPGDMLAVSLPVHDVETLLSDHPDIDLAASNSPRLTVVAGPTQAIAVFQSAVEVAGHRARLLHTSHAFHSAMMEPMLGEFEALVAETTRSAPGIPYLSNVTGTWITPEEATSPHYYARHVRGTVRFAEGLRVILEKHPNCLLLEMGPGRTLATLSSHQITDPKATIALPTLPGPKDEAEASAYVMEALGKVWASGQAIDWQAFYAEEDRRRIPLPTYAWQERPYLLDREETIEAALQPKRETDLQHCAYVPVWQQAPPQALAESGPEDLTGTWIFVRPRKEPPWLAPFAAHLEACGARLLSKSVDTLADSVGDWVATALENDDLAGVIHAGALGSAGMEDGFWPLFHLVQALGSKALDRQLRLFTLTDATLAVHSGERILPDKATLIGLCGVIDQEYTHYRSRCLDVGEQPHFKTLLAALKDDSGQPLAAVRHRHRYWRRFEPVTLPETRETRPLKDGGTYLITGGLGGLGLTIAHHLATSVKAPTLLLLGRSPHPAKEGNQERLDAIQALEDRGAKVDYASVNVADADALAAWWHAHGHVDGIVHTAGQLSDGIIQLKDAKAMQPVLDSKATAATHLLALSEKQAGGAPDFIALFSSISALLNTPGQSDYCAANAVLDALAFEAQQRDLPVISINWPAWRDTGMAARMQVAGMRDDEYQAMMTYALFPDEGAAMLLRALEHREVAPQFVVSTRPFQEHYEEEAILTQALIEEATVAPETCGAEDNADLTESERSMLGIWRDAFSNPQLTLDDDFFQSGGDSLLAVGLFTRIERTFEQSLPLSALFDAPTARQLLAVVRPEERALPLAAESAQDAGPDSESALATPTSAPHSKAPQASIPPHVIALTKAGSGTPLFAFHGADGGVLFYREFAQALGDQRPFYAVEAPMLRDLALEPLPTVEAIATAYLKDIRAVQPKGPYVLGGYSFGGTLAYEISQQLRAEGDDVAMLFLWDVPNLQVPPRKLGMTERIHTHWRRQSGNSVSRLGALTKRAFQGAAWKVQHEWENRSASKQGAAEKAGVGEYYRHVQARIAHEARMALYVPKPYAGPVRLYVADDRGDKFEFQPDLGWRGLFTGDHDILPVTGEHLEIFRGSNLPIIVEATAGVLRALG